MKLNPTTLKSGYMLDSEGMKSPLHTRIALEAIGSVQYM
jgi:hypothetical protein